MLLLTLTFFYILVHCRATAGRRNAGRALSSDRKKGRANRARGASVRVRQIFGEIGFDIQR